MDGLKGPETGRRSRSGASSRLWTFTEICPKDAVFPAELPAKGVYGVTTGRLYPIGTIGAAGILATCPGNFEHPGIIYR